MKRANKATITNIIIFIFFILGVLILGLHHEPWADEAQSWLIARDNSYLEIVRDVLKYEGHPLLWYFILRTLILMHFPYDWLFIIPFACACIGAGLILFKSKFPMIIKIIFPFTYYIFYQYGVVARSYSLVFPILALIAVSYKYRFKRPFLYSLLLILNAGISAQTFVISFILLCFYLFEALKLKTKIKKIKIFSGSLIVLGYMFLTALYLKTPLDCSARHYIHFDYINVMRILYTTAKSWFNLSGDFVGRSLYSITIIIFYTATVKYLCSTTYKKILFLALNFSVIIILTSLYCCAWHCGLVILTYMFSLWILCTKNELKFDKNKLCYIFMCVLFFIQVFWSIKSGADDYLGKYSGAAEAAGFIKNNNLTRGKIYGLGFKSVALQPYFPENIYGNYKSGKAYWQWKENAQYSDMEILNNLPETLVFSKEIINSKDNIIKLLTEKQYKKFDFKGSMFAKGYIIEDNSYTIFTKLK